MAEGFHKTISVSIATDAVATDPVKVRGFNRIAIEFPTFTASAANVAVKVQGSVTSTTSTFRTIKADTVNSAGSGIVDWEVLQGAGNFIADCAPAVGFNYVRFITNLTMTATVNGYVHVMK